MAEVKNITIAGDEFAAENYGMAVCNTNAEPLNRVNLGPASVKADGTLNQLVEKWITNGGK